MLDWIIKLILGNRATVEAISKRFISALVNKVVIIAIPFLAQFGLHLQVNDTIIVGTLVALVVNGIAYLAAETRRPSKPEEKK